MEDCKHEDTITKFSGAVLCRTCSYVVRYAGEPRFIITMAKEDKWISSESANGSAGEATTG